MVDLTGLSMSKKELLLIKNAASQFQQGKITASAFEELLKKLQTSSAQRENRKFSALRAGKLLKQIRGAFFRENVNSQTYRARLFSCKQCPHRVPVPITRQYICKLCGCLINFKASLKDSTCSDLDFQLREGQSRWS